MTLTRTQMRIYEYAREKKLQRFHTSKKLIKCEGLSHVGGKCAAYAVNYFAFFFHYFLIIILKVHNIPYMEHLLL